MNVLDLFSGIGGFSLGLEATGGFRTIAFCEIEPYCQAVLRKRWPDVPISPDITKLDGRSLRGRADVICGGFPCQDISAAGKGAGITGSRSGLWSEYARIIDEVRPRYVIVENVAMLLSRGLGRVLGDLAALGFDAEWHCVPASAIGARHRRDRVWIVAYPGCISGPGRGEAGDLACASGTSEGNGEERERNGNAPHDSRTTLANTASERRREARRYSERSAQRTSSGGEILADTNRTRLSQRNVNGGARAPQKRILTRRQLERARSTFGRQQWNVEPDVGRVADGIPNRVHRLRALGNSIVPQVAQFIGEAIIKTESHQPTT